ncbi:SDR family oxidoreductase [Microbacterium immunditiarum]|uniref:NAD(P)-dependent dehydrogenase (Short-subunit alcohol dehydrogenase family) n=1 Tax=Microbacterium immunditiarum TaxID=337480 RepID=A0A7Y9GPX3_9MICO|nr:NAD(P)-dependent dehydrogenase (short-subunit alcohol dehydrogenase family) [Microbacterium immunditiarum]
MAVDFGDGGAFILGGSGGLGSAISHAFAAAGVPVAITYRTREAAAEAVVAEVRSQGSDAESFAVDATDPQSIAQAMESASARFGGLHSVVYAAGPNFTPEFFSRTQPEVWDDWLRGDALAAINLAQAALPHLRKTAGSFTALTTYQAGLVEIRGGTSAISKAAVDRMVAVIAKEEGRFGVRANSVQCGWYDVEANRRLFAENPGLEAQKAAAIPLRRLGSRDEIGATVVFLSSRRAGFITGVNLTADGGESL